VLGPFFTTFDYLKHINGDEKLNDGITGRQGTIMDTKGSCDKSRMR